MKKILLISSCISLLFVFASDNLRSQGVKQAMLTGFGLHLP